MEDALEAISHTRFACWAEPVATERVDGYDLSVHKGENRDYGTPMLFVIVVCPGGAPFYVKADMTGGRVDGARATHSHGLRRLLARTFLRICVTFLRDDLKNGMGPGEVLQRHAAALGAYALWSEHSGHEVTFG